MKEGQPKGIVDRIREAPRTVFAATALPLAAMASACTGSDAQSPFERVVDSFEEAYKPVYGELPKEIEDNLIACRDGKESGAFPPGYDVTYDTLRVNNFCVAPARQAKQLGTPDGEKAGQLLGEFTIKVVLADLVAEGEIEPQDVAGWEKIVNEGINRK